jgi:secreted trypsin-like serine protease
MASSAVAVSSAPLKSAAHCCEGFSASAIEVLVGWHDLNNDNEGTRMDVSRITMYPNYNSQTLDGDICTLTLRTAVSSRMASPIALDTGSLNKANRMLTVAGWGNTATSGPIVIGSSFPSKAQEVDVPYQPNSVCNTSPSQYAGQITAGMLCAGFTSGGKDACQGDSGGPIFATINGVPTLTGVVSWGYGCAQPNAAGIYARVSHFISFIDGVSPSKACTQADYDCSGFTSFCLNHESKKCFTGTHCSNRYHKSHPTESPCVSNTLRGSVVVAEE